MRPPIMSLFLVKNCYEKHARDVLLLIDKMINIVNLILTEVLLYYVGQLTIFIYTNKFIFIELPNYTECISCVQATLHGYTVIYRT